MLSHALSEVEGFRSGCALSLSKGCFGPLCKCEQLPQEKVYARRSGNLGRT